MGTANRIPISVRISQEDADFIANLILEGANTPSEKIRELLKEARIARTNAQDYEHSLTHCEQMLLPSRHEVLLVEKQLGIHSPILARVFELMPDLMATLASTPDEPINSQSLIQHERQIVWRIVRLMDSVLQLAITGKGAGYDDAVLGELKNTLKLAQIVQEYSSQQGVFDE